MPASTFNSVSHVSISETADSITLVLAEDVSGSGSYLIIQRMQTAPIEEDIATKTDTYCLMDERGGVYYGGVTCVELAGTTLTFTLTEQAAEELNVRNEEGKIALHIPARDTERIGAMLRQVLLYGNSAVRPVLVGL